jgi:hypothetical protein
MTKSLVAVSQQSLFLAEAKIAGCSNCTDRAATRFERLLDTITGLPETTRYVLPTQAICPMCYNHVIESTMVSTAGKHGRRS